jgi:hypothetical protein
MNQFLVKETGKQQAHQVERQGSDHPFGGQVFAIQMINAAGLGIGGDQIVGQLRDCIHRSDLPQNGSETKILCRSGLGGYAGTVMAGGLIAAMNAWATFSTLKPCMQRKSIGHLRRKQGAQGTVDLSN